jgi:hypothetical protein
MLAERYANLEYYDVFIISCNSLRLQNLELKSPLALTLASCLSSGRGTTSRCLGLTPPVGLSPDVFFPPNFGFPASCLRSGRVEDPVVVLRA